jgi:iron(III) transport system substrate-binding protein
MAMPHITRRSLLQFGASAAVLSSAGWSGSALAQADSVNSLYEGAKREGTMTYYASDDVNITERVIAAFSEVYPGIKINYLRLASAQMGQRVAAEYGAGNFAADVIQFADPFAFKNAQKEGWLAPLSNLPAWQSFPKAYRTDYWSLIGIAPHTIIINSQIVPKEQYPKDWKGLLDPQWKGKLILSDPRNNIEVADWAYTMYKAYGKEYFVALKGQNPRWVPSIFPGMQMAAAGDGVIVAPGLHMGTILMQQKGAPLYDFSPTMSSGHETLVSVCARAAHPNVARLLVNYLMTREGQRVYCEEIAASPLGNIPGSLTLSSEYQRGRYDEALAMRAELSALLGLT